MPILNRFARPPRSWPIPRDPTAIGDSVRYAEERDPVGNAVHLALAMLFCASIALSTAMTSTSFVLLVGYTLLRLPNLWRALVPLVASPVVWLWLGWTAWTALNAFWSADLERWRDSLGSFWCVALLPALYPLTGRWRLLLGAYVAGAAVQVIFQAVQVFGYLLVPITYTGRLPGVGSHPGHVTTSAGIAVIVLVAWMREIRSTSGLAAAAIAMGCSFASLVLAAGRGGILGVLLGLAIMAVSLAGHHSIPWRGVRFRTGVALTAVAFGGLFLATAAGHGPASLRFQIEDLRQHEPDRLSSVTARYLWWGVSIDAFLAHPVRGIGTGSLYEFSAANPRTARMAEEQGLPISFLSARHPHSYYMLIAAEQGSVGLAWLTSTVIVTLGAAWRSVRIRPVACGVLGGLLTWYVSAGFECLNLPLRTASMLILLTALVALPRGPGVGLEPWRSEPDRN